MRRLCWRIFFLPRPWPVARRLTKKAASRACLALRHGPPAGAKLKLGLSPGDRCAPGEGRSDPLRKDKLLK